MLFSLASKSRGSMKSVCSSPSEVVLEVIKNSFLSAPPVIEKNTSLSPVNESENNNNIYQVKVRATLTTEKGLVNPEFIEFIYIWATRNRKNYISIFVKILVGSKHNNIKVVFRHRNISRGNFLRLKVYP
jgi:hypothetical protein